MQNDTSVLALTLQTTQLHAMFLHKEAGNRDSNSEPHA
jgi:hypothetical protein